MTSLQDYLHRTRDNLRTTTTETLPLQHLAGRILAHPLTADRDSPPCHVSAMDGYAVRLEDLHQDHLPIDGTNFAGFPSAPWRFAHARKVFTGAPVPLEADLVIRREETLESPSSIQIPPRALPWQVGENIRRQGENAKTGDTLVPAGTPITPAVAVTLMSFAPPEISVYRKLRVIILNTGDELVEPGASAKPWQIRDSNGPFLQHFLQRETWLDLLSIHRVPDDRHQLRHHIQLALQAADAVILSGGVSQGDSDFVPEITRELGGQIQFHRLPIRPGKPILAATWPNGQLLLGLPGNPLSVAVTARRFALPLLLHMAGAIPQPIHRGHVTLANPDSKSIGLTWFRLVSLTDQNGYLVDLRGSGDVAAISQSSGFVEIPPHTTSPGPFPYFPW